MDEELQAIEKNETWELISPPSSAKYIGLKWAFKMKKDLTGKILRHKARLAVKFGIDFEEVFTLVARLEMIQVILAIDALYGWLMHHLDVKSAFLNGEIEEEIYVK